MNGLSKKWFFLIVGGSLMLMTSILIFTASFQVSIYWKSAFFLFSGSASLISGVLMIADGIHYRFKETFGERKVKKSEKEIEREITFLRESCEQLRPETIRKYE